MRIVHTSDWHAGRVWKGLRRHDELAAVLDHLAGFVEREAVDLLLMTGDVFDHHVPAAHAERIVFEFFKRVGTSGTRSVVIAGNHDNADRIEAWGLLAELVGVHTVGWPRGPRDGGVLDIEVRSGERAIVAALPFAAPRTLIDAVRMTEGDAPQGYSAGMRRLIEELCSAFRPDAVNLLMAHTHLEGAVIAGSERRVHVGEEWAALRDALPTTADYVALGHIHRPQRIDAAVPTCYAGSPMQLDFGEAGEAKSFVSLAATAGRPVEIEEIPYEGARPLVRVRGTPERLAQRADELADAGWLAVTVELDAADPDIARRIRAMLPRAVSITAELPVEAQPRHETLLTLATASPSDVYAQWHRRHHRREPDAALLERFDALYRASDPNAPETNAPETAATRGDVEADAPVEGA